VTEEIMIKPIDSDPFAFYCYVEEEGYRWASGKFDSEPRLIGRGGFERRPPVRDRLPSGLFLEFANLEPNRDAILRFANRYGDLFDSYSLEDVVMKEGRMQGGATLKRWKGEIGDMHALVRIWEAIEKRNERELKKIITWDAKGVRYSIKTTKQEQHTRLAHSDDPENRLARFERGDTFLPAQYALQAEINRRIAAPQNLTVPRLVWTHEWTDERTRKRTGREERERYQRIIFTPSNLLAALWIQFAESLAKGYQLKLCQGCGGHFLSGPGARRADAMTCRDACRQRKRRRDSKS
jgi:hypothetical protein